MPSPTTCVWFDAERLEVRGGITKWIGSYYTLYPEAERCNRKDFVQRFRSGDLRRWPSWKHDRKEWLNVPPATLIGPIYITDAVRQWLRSLEISVESSISSIGDPPSTLVSTIGESLLLDICAVARYARVSRWIRRLTLSILRELGFNIIKTDVAYPNSVEESILWEGSELRSRLVLLQSYLPLNVEPAAFAVAANLLANLMSVNSSRDEMIDSVLTEIERLTTP